MRVAIHFLACTVKSTNWFTGRRFTSASLPSFKFTGKLSLQRSLMKLLLLGSDERKTRLDLNSARNKLKKKDFDERNGTAKTRKWNKHSANYIFSSLLLFFWRGVEENQIVDDRWNSMWGERENAEWARQLALEVSRWLLTIINLFKHR